MNVLSSNFIFLSGMTKIGFQDPEMPDYTEFFIKSEPFELSDIPTNPATVVISAETNKYHLELRIDFVGIGFI
jgi:hypothetical protein